MISAPQISAYVPCFNNESTLAKTVQSIRGQALPVDDLWVIDDGSTDGSAALAESLRCKVVRHAANLGRGAARARAMRETAHNLVLCCDATNVIDPDFLTRAMPWFDDPRVAAVCARFVTSGGEAIAERWKGRHLFKAESLQHLSHHAPLITGAAVLRTSPYLQVGGFDPLLRHSEDADLGERLLAAGYQVVADPELKLTSVIRNTLSEVMERYWRWYAGKDEAITLTGYLKQIAHAVKVMARQDLAARDPLCVPISLFVPHYQFWKSVARKIKSGS